MAKEQSTIQLPTEQAILAAITFFDYFSQPLTLLEIWQNLLFPERQISNLSEVYAMLHESPLLQRTIEQKDGLYFLKGNDSLISLRLDRVVITDKKFRKARRFARIFALVPFIRAIYACNSLGFCHANEESDIDFFIVTEKRALWVVRFFVTGIAHILGQRPTHANQKDRLCLSFFVADTHMNLSPLCLEATPEGVGDLYFAYWIIHCIPLYDVAHTHEEFVALNKWVFDMLPYAAVPLSCGRRMICQGRSEKILRYIVEWCASPLLGIFGVVLERIQRAIMPCHLREAASSNKGDVVMTNTCLKLHPVDRREEIRHHVWKIFQKLLQENKA